MDLIMFEDGQNRILGRAFHNARLPSALSAAKEYSGVSGHVASMPELLGMRVLNPFDSTAWTDWYTANSEELVGTTTVGTKVVVINHGDGILSLPERIEQAYREGLTNDSAARLTAPEFINTLERNAVLTLQDVINGFHKRERNYSIVLDFEIAKRMVTGYLDIDSLYEHPLFIARAGGVEEAKAFLDKAKQKWKKYGNWHPFNNIDPEQPQGRLLFLGDYYIDGLDGGSSMYNYGRFVGVRERSEHLAPKAQRTQGSPSS